MLLPQTSQGQYKSIFGKNSWYYKAIYIENAKKDHTAKNAVKERVLVMKGSGVDENSIVNYDPEGRVTVYKGNRCPELQISYLKGNLFKEIRIMKNNKLIERDSFSYSNGRIEECFYFDEDNQLFKMESYKYKDSLLLEYVYGKLKKGKFIEKRKQVYEYYPDNSPKKITYYRNNKMDYYTVFDCDPVGKYHKVKRDSSYTCIKQEQDSLGNNVKITIVNERVYPRKEVEYFNEKNECIARKTYDLKNNEPLWFYFFKSGVPDYVEFVSYKNQKEFYRIKRLYNQNNQQIESTTYSHRRLKRKDVTEYNQKGLAEKEKRYNKKNKVVRESTIAYKYH